jgi:hypothetical protein
MIAAADRHLTLIAADCQSEQKDVDNPSNHEPRHRSVINNTELLQGTGQSKP